MVDQLVRRSLDHPKRRWVVWGITLFLLLFVTLPCWDHYGDRQSEVRSLSTELYEATLASNNVAAMQSRLAQLGTQDGQQNLFFDQDRAEQFRESVTEITFDLQCQLKRLTLSDPRQTPWVPSQGLGSNAEIEEGIESDFNLETRLLNLSATGPLTNLTKLIIRLNSIAEFAVPTNLTVQREGNHGHLSLDIEISLLGLVPANDSRM